MSRAPAEDAKAERGERAGSQPVTSGQIDEAKIDEGKTLKQLSESVGEERHLGVAGDVGQPASPLGLRFFALQRAETLDVDTGKAAAVLAGAQAATAGAVEADVPLLHRAAPLEGAAASDRLIDPLQKTVLLGGEEGTDVAKGTAEGRLGTDSGHLSGVVERDGEGALGQHRAAARGNVSATGSGVRLDAGGEAGLSTKTEDGADVVAGARGGVKVDESGAVTVDVGLDASARSVVERTLPGGGKETVTTVSSAKGDALRGTFSGERSQTRKSEQTRDGVVVTNERVGGVRGDSSQKTVEAFASHTSSEARGADVTARRVEGRAGLQGARGKVTYEERNTHTGEGRRRSAEAAYEDNRLSAKGEWVNLGREETPQGEARDVERGYTGKGDVHRLGFSADVQRKTSDGEGGVLRRGASVVYDPTGLALGGTRDKEDADGDARGASEGVKVSGKTAGVTMARSQRQRLSDTEALVSERSLDVMLGDRQVSATLGRTETRARLGGQGTLEQRSTFERLTGKLAAYRIVTDKGPVTTGDPSLEGKHAVEVHQKVDGGGGAFLGRLNGAVGLFGGLALSRGKDIVYRTHLDPGAAAAAAKPDEEKGAAALARKHLPGVSLASPSKVALPDLSRPETLQLYDEVELQTTGGMRAEVGASAYGARAGIGLELQGDFALQVKKVGAHVVEVDVVPTHIRGVRGTAGALLVEGSVGYVAASSFRQRFSFDLRSEGGRAAYEASLRGQMPGGLRPTDVDARADGLGLVAKNDLPDGVTRLLVEKVEVAQSDVDASAGWMFLKAGRARSRRTTEHMVSDGDVSVNLHSRGLEHRRKTLLSGSETRAVTGSLRAVTVVGDDGRKVSTFDGLSLEARLSDDKLKGRELNDHMVSVLNDAFGLALPSSSLQGKKEGREVSASVTLTPASLSRLKGADDAAVARVAKERGASRRSLAKLVADVRRAPDDKAAARAVQRYVADHGVRGMGQVVALAGATDRLVVSTTTTAYDAPLADAKTYASRFAETPWDVNTSKKDVTARYDAVHKTMTALDEGLARLHDDPFYAGRDDERAALAAALQEARASLEPLCDFSTLAPEDALALYQKVDGGWTTSTQARFLEELASEAGLADVTSGLFTATATAEHRSGDETVRARTISDRRWLPLFGDERTRVTARTRLVHDDEGGTSLRGLTLRAEIYDEKSRLREAAGTAAWLASAFGQDLGSVGTAALRSSVERTITVERSLDHAAIGALRTLDGRTATQRSRGAPSPKRVLSLARDLAAAGDDVSAARVIEGHVERHGVDGMGDVHRLLGGGPLDIGSETTAYDAALAGAAEVSAEYPAPLAADASTDEVARRFKAVAKATVALDNAATLLSADELAPPEARQATQARIEEARAALANVTHVGHLSHHEGAELVSRLDAGWVTKHEAAAATAIRDQAGLVEVRASSGALVARSSRQGADGTVDVVSRRERAVLSLQNEQVTVTSRRAPGAGALSADVHFVDDAEQDGELASEVVSRINRAFGTTFSRRPTTADGSARTVTVRVALDEAALRSLARAPWEAALAEAEVAGVSRTAAAAFLSTLRRAPDDGLRAAEVQTFLADHGVEGLGWLHRLARPGAVPDVTTESAGVAAALARADEAILLYGGRGAWPEMTRGQLLASQDALESARRAVTTTAARVATDPLLSDDDKARLAAELTSREHTLADAASFSHLAPAERRALRARLTTLDGLRHPKIVDRLRKGA